MSINNSSKIEDCPKLNLSLYLDGELSLIDEIEIESHLAICPVCSSEVNLQKKLLSTLNFVFDEKNDVDLPPDFTKIVVAKAESNVKGLRCKHERLKAAILLLPLICLAVLGLQNEEIMPFVTGTLNKISAVFLFLFNLVFDLCFSVNVILRTVSQKIAFNSIFSLIFISSLFLITFYFLSRIYLRMSREKIS